MKDVICDACRERRHRECRGGTWCDCQHRPPEADGPEEERPAPAEGTEPDINWLRQG